MTFKVDDFITQIINSDKLQSLSELTIRPFSWSDVYTRLFNYSVENQRDFFYSLGKSLENINKYASSSEAMKSSHQRLLLDIYRPLKDVILENPAYHWNEIVYFTNSLEVMNYLNKLAIFENGVILGPHPNRRAITVLMTTAGLDADKALLNIGVDINDSTIQENLYKAKRQLLDIYFNLDHVANDHTSRLISILIYTAIPRFRSDWYLLSYSESLSVIHADITVQLNNEGGTPDRIRARLHDYYSNFIPDAFFNNVCLQLELLPSDKEFQLTDLISAHAAIEEIPDCATPDL